MAPGPLHPGWRSLFELNTIEGGPLTSLFPHSPLHTFHPHTLPPTLFTPTPSPRTRSGPLR